MVSEGFQWGSKGLNNHVATGSKCKLSYFALVVCNSLYIASAALNNFTQFKLLWFSFFTCKITAAKSLVLRTSMHV